MSLRTWIDEFYPVRADSSPGSEAVAHSLRKWEGLLKKNLEKHGVHIFFPGGVWDLTGDKFFFSANTCALCELYLSHSDGDCSACPIYKESGRGCSDEGSAYRIFSSNNNPIPMIRLLRKIRKKEVEGRL